MDPMATWQLVKQYMSEGTDGWEDALELADDLCQWLRRDGYRSSGLNVTAAQLDGFCSVMEQIRSELNVHVNPDLGG